MMEREEGEEEEEDESEEEEEVEEEEEEEEGEEGGGQRGRRVERARWMIVMVDWWTEATGETTKEAHLEGRWKRKEQERKDEEPRKGVWRKKGGQSWKEKGRRVERARWMIVMVDWWKERRGKQEKEHIYETNKRDRIKENNHKWQLRIN